MVLLSIDSIAFLAFTAKQSPAIFRLLQQWIPRLVLVMVTSYWRPGRLRIRQAEALHSSLLIKFVNFLIKRIYGTHFSLQTATCTSL